MRKFTYYGSFASVVSDYFTNLFGVPDAAYSLRKLSPNSVYSGAAIRVRRSSDNTEQDINFVSSAIDAGLDTAALLAFVGSGNGFVTRWYDQSGLNRDVYQASSANQPIIVSVGVINIEDGKPAIRFNGSTTQLQSGIFTASSQPITRIAVAKQTFPNWGYVIDGSSTNRAIVGTNNSSNHRIFSGSVSDYLVANDGNRHIRWALFNSPNSELFINNGASLGLINNGTQGLNGVTIGASALGASSQNLLGNVQSVIIYASDKASDKLGIITNINDFYGIF